MIINHWAPYFTQHYGHIFPESYLSVDTEYTGGNADKDLIMEIGHTMVRDRVEVDRLNVVLDWSLHPQVPNSWLRRRLEHRMVNTNGHWRISWEVMKNEGIDPLKALRFYRKLMLTWKKQGLPFVAHNGYYADERMIRGNFEGFLLKRFSFDENGLFDTGAIFKATQALQSSDPLIRAKHDKFLPHQDDTLRSYFKRVVGHPVKGIKWNLRACLEYYELDTKYGIDVDQLHTADYDSWCVHLLMEEFRRWITHQNNDENPFTNSHTLQRAFEQEIAKGNVAEADKKAAEEDFEQRQGGGHAPKGFNRRRQAKARPRRRKQRSV